MWIHRHWQCLLRVVLEGADGYPQIIRVLFSEFFQAKTRDSTPSLPRLTMPRKDMKLLFGGSPHELSVLTGYHGRIFHQTQNYLWCPRYQPILLVGPPPCTITQDMGVLPKSCHVSEFFIAHTSITDPI